jgi:hypothetical protein
MINYQIFGLCHLMVFVYFEDELILASTLKRLGKDDARQPAALIARLPELLQEARKLARSAG